MTKLRHDGDSGFVAETADGAISAKKSVNHSSHPTIVAAMEATPEAIYNPKLFADLTRILGANDPALLASVLGELARRRGMREVAKAAGMSREALYKAVYESDHWKDRIAPRVPDHLDRSAMVVTRIIPTAKSTMR